MRTPTIALVITLVAAAALAQESRGIALYREGKYAEAANALKTEVEKAPSDDRALTYLGLSRVRAGDANGARGPLEQALARNANNAEAHFGMGLVNLKLNKLPEAVTELEKATKLAPDHAYALYYLGIAYNQKGDKDLAVPAWRRFLELAPKAPEAPAVRSFLNRM